MNPAGNRGDGVNDKGDGPDLRLLRDGEKGFEKEGVSEKTKNLANVGNGIEPIRGPAGKSVAEPVLEERPGGR